MARAEVNRVRSPVSARIEAAPTGDSPSIDGHELGEAEQVERLDHALLDLGLVRSAASQSARIQPIRSNPPLRTAS